MSQNGGGWLIERSLAAFGRVRVKPNNISCHGVFLLSLSLGDLCLIEDPKNFGGVCADASVGRPAKKALRSQQEEDEEEEGVARQALRRVLPSLSLSLARAAFVQTSRDAFGLWTAFFASPVLPGYGPLCSCEHALKAE